jgi:hypothetical protein
MDMNILTKLAPIVLSSMAALAYATDYTVDCNAVQFSLSTCSVNEYNCVIPTGKVCTVTSPLYMWGKSSLTSSGGGGITFAQSTANPYLFNLGISGPQNPSALTANIAPVFTGKIAGVTFTMAGVQGVGRILYLWRTNGAVIDSNIFNIGAYNYSATSSGNNNSWVYNGATISTNVIISNNTVKATSAGNAPNGNEGIAIGPFTTASIVGNTVIGVGDDPIAVHLSHHVKILNNTVKSTHGRIFVSNSDNVEIAYNNHTRIPSLSNGNFYAGISLLYVGFESYSIDAGNTTPYFAPDTINIHENFLRYPAGAIDNGSAIYLYALRNSTVQKNVIVNDAIPTQGQAGSLAAIYLLPAIVTSAGSPRWWVDPTGLDSTSTTTGNPRVHAVTIDRNVSTGSLPLAFTGSATNCSQFVGPVSFTNNIGTPPGVYAYNVVGYSFACPLQTVSGNMSESISPANF